MFNVSHFSGVKRTGFLGGEVPSLFSQCIQVLKQNVDYIEEVGGLPYDIMKPVLLMASDTTLMRIEDCNPHLMEFTGEVSVFPLQQVHQLVTNTFSAALGQVGEKTFLQQETRRDGEFT